MNINKPMKWWRIIVWGFLLAGWIGLLFLFSSQSYEEQSIQPLLIHYFGHDQLVEWLPDVTIAYEGSVINSHELPYHFVEFYFRKGAHFFVYAVYASLLFMFLRALSRGRWLLSAVITLLVAIAVPALDEWNQLGSEERTGSLMDVVLDFIGVCTGLFVCLCILGLIHLWRTWRRNVNHRVGNFRK